MERPSRGDRVDKGRTSRRPFSHTRAPLASPITSVASRIPEHGAQGQGLCQPGGCRHACRTMPLILSQVPVEGTYILMPRHQNARPSKCSIRPCHGRIAIRPGLGEVVSGVATPQGVRESGHQGPPPGRVPCTVCRVPRTTHARACIMTSHLTATAAAATYGASAIANTCCTYLNMSQDQRGHWPVRSTVLRMNSISRPGPGGASANPRGRPRRRVKYPRTCVCPWPVTSGTVPAACPCPCPCPCRQRVTELCSGEPALPRPTYRRIRIHADQSAVLSLCVTMTYLLTYRELVRTRTRARLLARAHVDGTRHRGTGGSPEKLRDELLLIPASVRAPAGCGQEKPMHGALDAGEGVLVSSTGGTVRDARRGRGRSSHAH
ncbi:hypothetical protein C8Q80DRAFT_627320 [Daedaleopsis nitida]|nr:hypothetical protein C8Q80DRAFT_627320 [Daedaleopsis nitida]